MKWALHPIALTAIFQGAAAIHAADFAQPLRPFIESYCAECHNAEEKKAGLDFETLPARLDDPATETRWTLIHDRVERGEMPPPKKKQPKAEARSGFLDSLGRVLSEHDAARQAKTGRVVLRRLTRTEYEATIHDLLAIDAPLATLLPEDSAAHGFDNVADALRLSAEQIESYLTGADAALDAALKLGPRPPLTKQYFSPFADPSGKKPLNVPATVPNPVQSDGNATNIYRAQANFPVVVNRNHHLVLRQSRARASGAYRVRLSAFGFQSGGNTMVVKLLVNRFQIAPVLAAFDLPGDRPRVAETIVHLDEGEVLEVHPDGRGTEPDGGLIYKIDWGYKMAGSENAKLPGSAIEWIEIEGPLQESWPPPSVQKVFEDMPVNLLPMQKGTARDARMYEIIASNPSQDAARIVAAFAGRAFRRGPNPEGAERYIRVALDALAAGNTFEDAVRRACKTVLTSPEFLFLQENSGKLDEYALASRLSYFLWNTMPDAELLRLATDGKLSTPSTLREQTERMLANPKARAFTRNFCGQWLDLRSIDLTKPDKRLYPEFDDLLKDAMVRETEFFFEEMLRRDLGIATLIDSDFAMLNRRLAEHYGIPGVFGEETRQVALPNGSHRGGLLTQASILKVTANGTFSSPVLRGLWVMKRILGRPAQPQPAGVGAIEPDTRGATTIRQQLEKHRSSATCASCHRHMDPPGFALESYDVIGGWREWYRVQESGEPVIDTATGKERPFRKGPPVDSSGELPDGRTFANLDEFKKLLLVQQETIARNLVNQLVTYATGATVTLADRASVDAIVRQSQTRSYGLRTLVHGVIQSPLFHTK